MDSDFCHMGSHWKPKLDECASAMVTDFEAAGMFTSDHVAN
jgi:hypothetical protein